MELTYKKGTYHNEIIKKLELLKLLKEQSTLEQTVAKENINNVKADIDRSIMFHIENLQKRGSWLKSHAEHIQSLMSDSMERRIRQIEESIMLVTKNLENPNYEELDDILEMSLPFLPDTNLVTFSASNNGDDETLYENIKSFGNITTTQQNGQDENEDSFIFADHEDDDDDIEIIKFHQHQTEDEWLLKTSKSSSTDETQSRNDDDECWLIQDGSINLSDTVDMTTTTTTTTSYGSEYLGYHNSSEWLVKARSDSNIFDSYSSSDFKDTDIGEDPVSLQSYLSHEPKGNGEEEEEDLPLHSFLHHSSKWNHDAGSYTYPKRSFLEHWDFLENQDVSVYLITKDDDAIEEEKESDRCQWLYRKEDCQVNGECSSSTNGCEMFDKEWLHTANDW